MKKSVTYLFGALIFVLSTGVSAQLVSWVTYGHLLLPTLGPSEESRRPLISKVSGTPSKTIRILFLGNSFTSVNDLPGMLIQIASSDSTNTIQLEVLSVTKDGGRLANLWQEPAARTVLQSRQWNYLVLQEHSGWIDSPDNIEETYSVVMQWTSAAKQGLAKPVFIEDWSDKAGATQYTDEHFYMHGRDPDEVQRWFDSQSRTISKRMNMEFIPVGNYADCHCFALTSSGRISNSASIRVYS
jgi:hypothetical protein